MYSHLLKDIYIKKHHNIINNPKYKLYHFYLLIPLIYQIKVFNSKNKLFNFYRIQNSAL